MNTLQTQGSLVCKTASRIVNSCARTSHTLTSEFHPFHSDFNIRKKNHIIMNDRYAILSMERFAYTCSNCKEKNATSNIIIKTLRPRPWISLCDNCSSVNKM